MKMFNIKFKIQLKRKHNAYGYFSYIIHWLLILTMVLLLAIGITITIVGTYSFVEVNKNLIFLGLALFIIGLILNFIISLNSQKIRNNIYMLEEQGYELKSVVVKNITTYKYFKNNQEYNFKDALQIIKKQKTKLKGKQMVKKDWKSTLLMPKTQFDMKANLVSKEIVYQKMWIDKDIYNKALNQNQNNTPFILHDGPPYANGSLHVGHALNKILKDIVVRYKTMNGFYAPYIPGWDVHGLPIENKMLEELKMSKNDLDKLSLRKEAAKYAWKQIDIQKQQFQTMSLFTNMQEFYVTLDKEFEVGQLKLFKKMFLKNLIYKGLRPVYWSPSSTSALAEAEVEYHDISSPQIIVAFQVVNGNKFVEQGTHLTIMTTTPWTLIANAGVAIGKKFDYNIVRVKNAKYIVAAKLTDSIAKLAKWKEYQVLNTLKGKALIGLTYKRPIKNNLEAPIVAGEHVTIETGTGLVHMAPLFGEDDFEICKTNNLDMIMHVQDDGTFNKQAGKYAGLFYEAANKEIGMFLDSQSMLLSLKFVKHSYPHDWRTHKPIIFRATPQWFVSIEKIKQTILLELKKSHSHPTWGIAHISKMIDSRNDWTISRQRTWGVPIIIFYDQDGNIATNEELLDHVIALVKQHGTNIWWQKDTDQLLPKSYRNKGYTREMDIMDVWFDSGSSHIYMEEFLKNKYGIQIKGQFDLYLEGNDQYRGWFNSSLINSIAYRQKSPYKHVVSHGFVLDGKNQKMSKSKGNIINPLDIIKKSGADILRLWVANSEYTSDVAISDDIIVQTSQLYRNFRTKIRFILGNLFDFNEADKLELTGFHKLIKERLNNLKHFYAQKMNSYKFNAVIKEMNYFLLEASSFYFDYAKDALYVEKPNSHERRMFQTNMFEIVDFFIIALAPFLPTSMEDAYTNFSKANKKESVHLEVMKLENIIKSTKEEKKYKLFFEFKDNVYKILEQARQEGMIRRANEAIIIGSINYLLKKLNIPSAKKLATMLMVGKIININSKDTTNIKVSAFDSEKCQRCWNHFDKGTLNEEHICKRCENVINNI